jgi:hypothetical protein
MQISQRENYFGKFNDKRLDKRAHQLSSLLYFGGSSSIHRIALKESEQKGIYRFLSNKKVSEEILIRTAIEKSGCLCADRDVLVPQDTTEVNLQDHHKRLKRGKGVGLTGNNYDKGFFFHGSMVLDAHTSMVLGFSNVQLWHRKENKFSKEQRGYKGLPIAKKESNKWIKAAQQSKEHLQNARSITFIEDREGDIYEQFASIPDSRTHLIIRSRDDRRLADGDKLFRLLAAQRAAGSYIIELVKDLRKGIKKRRAVVEVRFCKVSIAKPKRLNSTAIADCVELNAVEVRESKGPKKGAILWRILTTHAVNNYEQAVSVVNKYRQRWHIEQLFRLMKKKGFQIESSELETGWAIRKLTVMILSSALRVMQLRLAYNKEDSQPIEEVFDEDEIKCMKATNESLQGRTKKLKNTNNPQKLSWATWIIARLGGWKPYDNNRPPGPVILKRGLEQFEVMFKGWKLALRKDVS